MPMKASTLRSPKPSPLLADQPRRHRRRRHCGRGAGGRADGRRLGPREPARSRAAAAWADRSRRRCRRDSSASSWPSAFEQAVPLIVVEGFVAGAGKRTPRVARAGVRRRRSVLAVPRPRRVKAPGANEALLSEGACRRARCERRPVGVLRVENSSAIPTESLHGRKEDVGRSVRLTVRQVLAREELGEFSLSPRQGSIRAIFVPLAQDADAARAARSRERDPDRRRSMRGSGRAQTPRSRRVVDDFGLRVRALDALGAIARRKPQHDAERRVPRPRRCGPRNARA